MYIQIYLIQDFLHVSLERSGFAAVKHIGIPLWACLVTFKHDKTVLHMWENKFTIKLLNNN